MNEDYRRFSKLELKSLFSQLGHANEGSHSIDEDTLEEFIRRLQDAATTLRLLVDHILRTLRQEQGTKI
jgi:DNA mismatch repair ATPase MutS